MAVTVKKKKKTSKALKKKSTDAAFAKATKKAAKAVQKKAAKAVQKKAAKTKQKKAAKTAPLYINIYIKEKNGKQKIQIPWLPETIEYKTGDVTFASYDILNRGEVVKPTGTGLAKISWEGVFPGTKRTDSDGVDKSMFHGKTVKKPNKYHEILEKWRKNGTELNVMVTGYPINKDVYLSNYESKATGGFGDLEYSIEFTEIRKITVNAKKKKKKDKNSSTKRSKKSKATYTIKRGDTLWGISKKFYGSGSSWKKIYTANKTIIESTAKKRGYKSSNNGNRIFPGVKISIPK